MTKLIFLLVKITVGTFFGAIGLMSIVFVFVFAFPIAGFDKIRHSFKRAASGNYKICICNDIEKHSPGGRCEAHN